jgi:hypothetical protein
MTNSSACVLTGFLESLRSKKNSISESTANKKSSESLEDTFQSTLVKGGLIDLTHELEKSKKGQSSIFSQASTKGARKKQFHIVKDYIADVQLDSKKLRKDTQGIFPENCFIRHPCGPGHKPDFLVVINGWMLYWEMKTSTQGFNGKLNDKPIPAQSFVLCSSGSTKLTCPFTWFQVADIMNDETWAYYNAVLPRLRKARDDLRAATAHLFTDAVRGYASEVSLRGIVGWGQSNNDWFRKTINGFTPQQREQRVIDIIQAL